jgi:threonine/homoserine/homoserine lactone efflux protein
MSDAIPTPVTANLVSFALSYFLLAAVPGPNFLVVSDAGLTSKRSDALSAAFGIALGAGLLSVIVTQIAGIILADALFRRAAASAFGFYLIFLGLKSWGRAGAVRRLMHMPKAVATNGYFRLALLTAIANPTTALFVGASSFGKASLTPMEVAAMPLIVFAIAFMWFGAVGMALSRWGKAILPLHLAGRRDFVFGAAFILLGAISILSARG